MLCEPVVMGAGKSEAVWRRLVGEAGVGGRELSDFPPRKRLGQTLWAVKKPRVIPDGLDREAQWPHGNSKHEIQ